MRKPEALSLPEKLFLLAFDLRRQRLTARSELGYLLRAAALAELVRRGNLEDSSGKARPAGSATGLDPMLAAVWDQIGQTPPRSWRRWVSKDRRQTVHAVREQLEQARLIKLEPRRLLGVFPVTKITLRQPHVARRLGEQVGRAIRGGRPAAGVDSDIAALAALAAAGQLRMVLGAGERRRFEQRIAELSAPIEPITTALRKAITSQRAAAASSG